tara:strand:+ start:484 stop:711 length:228 start_codon:yes stop_codon:yes gene_type:complete
MEKIIKEKIDVFSSMVQSITYTPMKKTLLVKFSSGAKYIYLDVDGGTFEGLRSAVSKGAYLNRNVIRLFSYKKIK